MKLGTIALDAIEDAARGASGDKVLVQKDEVIALITEIRKNRSLLRRARVALRALLEKIPDT